MKRVTVLATLLMAGALSLAVTAWQQPPAGEAPGAYPGGDQPGGPNR